MSHTENSTIPIHKNTLPEVPDEILVNPSKVPKTKRSVVLTISLSATILIAIGWGGWQFFGPAKSVDVDVIAELEGFESAPGFTSTAPVFTAVPMPVDDLDENQTKNELPILGSVNSMHSERIVADRLREKKIENSPDVWLTGTIELTDQLSTSESSRQISGSPNDSSTIR